MPTAGGSQCHASLLRQHGILVANFSVRDSSAPLAIGPTLVGLFSNEIDDQADKRQSQRRVSKVDAVEILRRDASQHAIGTSPHRCRSDVGPAQYAHLAHNAA